MITSQLCQPAPWEVLFSSRSIARSNIWSCVLVTAQPWMFVSCIVRYWTRAQNRSRAVSCQIGSQLDGLITETDPPLQTWIPIRVVKTAGNICMNMVPCAAAQNSKYLLYLNEICRVCFCIIYDSLKNNFPWN